MAIPSPRTRHRPAAGERQAIVIGVCGEINRATARRLQALARELVDAGVAAVAIDCTQTPGPSGHLLGALRNVADAASRRRVTVGVAIDGAGGDVIRAHAPGLLAAPTRARLFDTLGIDHQPAEINLVTRPDSAQTHPA